MTSTQKRNGAVTGAALKIVYTAENRPFQPKNQEENDVFEEFRRAYSALEMDPDNDFSRIALRKAQRAWRNLTERGAHAAVQ